MAKTTPPTERRPLSHLLAGACRFREWAALELLAAHYARSGLPADEAECEHQSRLAVLAADTLAVELERTDESRADHPARKEDAP